MPVVTGPMISLSLLAPVQAAQVAAATIQTEPIAEDEVAEVPAEIEKPTSSGRTEDGTPAQPTKKVRPPVQGLVSPLQDSRQSEKPCTMLVRIIWHFRKVYRKIVSLRIMITLADCRHNLQQQMVALNGMP